MPRRHGGLRHPILDALGVGAISFGAAAGAIGATYKITEFLVKCKRLFDVRSENEVFVRLIERARIDLNEVERLLAQAEVKTALRQTPQKAVWIRETMAAMRQALERMTKYTDKVTKAGAFLGPRTRIWWLMDEYEKLVHRRLEVAMCHQGVLSVIDFLSQLELARLEGSKSGSVHRGSHVGVERSSRFGETEGEGRRGPWRDRRRVQEFDIIGNGRQIPGPLSSTLQPVNQGNGGFFYNGQLDGPLATRPRFWGGQDTGLDDYLRGPTSIQIPDESNMAPPRPGSIRSRL